MIVFVITLLASIIAAVATFRAKEYSSVLPSSLLAVTWGRFMLGVFALDYEEIYSSLGLTSLPVTLGLGIILTAAGCLLQFFILKKTDMGKKKRNSGRQSMRQDIIQDMTQVMEAAMILEKKK